MCVRVCASLIAARKFPVAQINSMSSCTTEVKTEGKDSPSDASEYISIQVTQDAAEDRFMWFVCKRILRSFDY